MCLCMPVRNRFNDIQILIEMISFASFAYKLTIVASIFLY